MNEIPAHLGNPHVTFLDLINPAARDAKLAAVVGNAREKRTWTEVSRTQPEIDPRATVYIEPHRKQGIRRRYIEEELLWGTGSSRIIKELTPNRAYLYRLPSGRHYVGFGRPHEAGTYTPALNYNG